jgi:hypothetical protein
VQNLFLSSLLTKNIKIKVYRAVILCVVLNGRETPVSHNEERLYDVGFWEYGAEEDIWTEKGRGNRGVEKTT